MVSKQLAFHIGQEGRLMGSLVLPEKENYHLERILSELRREFPTGLKIIENLSALVGSGITDRYDYLQQALALLDQHGISACSCHTSSFRISLLVDRARLQETVQTLYEKFLRSPD